MIEGYRSRVFRLSRHGTVCGPDGISIGGVALIARSSMGSRVDTRSVRPAAELEQELSALYGLPVDIGSKLGRLECIAKALGRGDFVLAQISALLLQFPDPPSLGKTADSADGSHSLALELAWSGLLKDDDFEEKHPRAGTAPNRGWFATKPREISGPRRVPRDGTA